MKGIYLVALLSAAIVFDDVSLQEIPTECPAVDPVDTTIHLSFPGDCTKFYKCFNGDKIPMDCPWMDKEKTKRLHFNPRLQVCDWPNSAGCKDGGPTDPCPKDTNGKTITIPHEIFCDLFYLCTDGVKDLVRCTDGKLYDETSGLCKLPAEVNCGNRIITTPGTSSTPKDRWTCPPRGSPEKVLLPHECACDKYYECLDGHMVLRECDKGLHFDYIREVCDYPDIVKCVRPIPETTTPMSMSASDSYVECANEEEEGMKYSHETSCSAYYECSNGQKSLKNCTEGLYFDAIVQTCDYPEEKCDLTVRKLPDTTFIYSYSTTSPSLYECPPKHSKRRARLPHEYSCRYYYKCYKGRRIRKRCPHGMHYDYIREICDDPEIVKCVRPIPPPTTETTTATTITTPKPNVCPPKGSTKKVRLPHECSCAHYYECIDGLMIRQVCPAGLHFDYVRQICDDPDIVKCKRPTFQTILEEITSTTEYETQTNVDLR